MLPFWLYNSHLLIMDSSSSYKYQHLFFDWDHTLWDFETNSRLTLTEIFHGFDLMRFGITSLDEFLSVYQTINHMLWHEYGQKRIDKETLRDTRFERVLAHFGIIDKSIGNKINHQYLNESPKKTALMPNALETLNYLQTRYQLHLITNGFVETQKTKIEGSGLAKHFTSITTSEKTGYLKPDVRVFEIALSEANAEKSNSIYIGDHFETDVIGSKNAGLDQIYFNPVGIAPLFKPTFEITDLIELKEIL